MPAPQTKEYKIVTTYDEHQFNDRVNEYAKQGFVVTDMTVNRYPQGFMTAFQYVAFMERPYIK